MRERTWTITDEYSRLSFKFKYLEFSHISGQFLHFNGKVIANEFFDSPEIYLFLDANSVETHHKKTNDLLRSRKILHVDQFPFIEFNSLDGCSLKSGRIWELTGDLMIKDIKKKTTLIVSHSDIKIDEKKGLAKFRFLGDLSRKTFDLGCLEEKQYSDLISISADMILQTIV